MYEQHQLVNQKNDISNTSVTNLHSKCAKCILYSTASDIFAHAAVANSPGATLRWLNCCGLVAELWE